MDYEFLHSVFPNYTLEMWKGNEPSILKYHERVNGGYSQKWSWEYGLAETYEENNQVNIISADVGLPSGLNVFICGDFLELSYNPITLENKYWAWTNKDGGIFRMNGYKYVIPEAKIRRMMRKEIPDCVIWRLIKERMWELFEAAEYKGDYRE